jgi:hypothetical protein
VAVDEAGQDGAAGRVDLDVGRARGEPGDPAVRDGELPGLERQRRRAVVAHVGQPVLGGPENLRGVADRDAHRMGIRTPSRSAASIASS